MRYQKRPVVVEAIQFDGGNFASIQKFAGHWLSVGEISKRVFVTTPSGAVQVVASDWIIKGGPADFYPCKADVFEATYLAVE